MAKMIRVRMESKLPVIFLKEDRAFIAYTPALDLSTCGETIEEAKANFEQAVKIFFQECTKRGTLEDVLISLGWKKSTTRPQTWQPPEVVGHIDLPIPQYA
jgi:predicted RNase H-like HicB family nuclease